MWIRNLDTGKWSLQVDQLPKDYYDGLKQDIESVKLYSKCLSGAVYISIDNFDNIYNTLGIDILGYYIDNTYANLNLPLSGRPKLSLNSSNYEVFYQRYLKENAFTIKNLFTPSKLVNSEIENTSTVDVATTEMIADLTGSKKVLTIDGLRIIEGHRVLVKDQRSEVTIPNTQNVEDYFTNKNPASGYLFVESNVTDITYSYLNEDNGIYKFTNNRLVKESDLVGYDKSYKYKVIVKYGTVNYDKEFHLDRLKNNYFPIDGENVSFTEKQSWILRHRLDYNNILELNHYDLLQTKATQVYSRVDDFTYSIPERLLAVGEFGIIINNQDKLHPSATYSNSSIINTKYKVNFRNITETNDYYWVCGDEATLLKIYKPDLSIQRIELGIFSQLTSISFFDNLNGFVVGKFNTIFYTTDGGVRWQKITYPEYESYSYTKVIFNGLNKIYITGTNGLFLELQKDVSGWISYKRQIYKSQNGDRYILVDDLYDIIKLDWATLIPFSFVHNDQSKDFADSLNYQFEISKSDYKTLQIDISTQYSLTANFISSTYAVTFNLSTPTDLIYTDGSYSSSFPLQYSLYQLAPNSKKTSKFITLPINSNGNLIENNYTLDVGVYYNYDADTNSITGSYSYKNYSITFSTIKTETIMLPSDNKVIVYEPKGLLYSGGNDFIYMEFDKVVNDVRTITKPIISSNDKIYIGADKVYYFNFSDINSIINKQENFVTSKLIQGPDLYVNRMVASDKLYLVGNESLLKTIELSNVGVNNTTYLWDPTFITKYKPRFLFLDYDVASKLNFFTDFGQYRMPETLYISNSGLTSTASYLEFKSIDGQTSWVDYYKDGEKTFEYYSFMGDTKKVEFSTKFTYTPLDTNFILTSNQISGSFSSIVKLAPSLSNSSSSEFYEGLTPIITTTQFNTLSNHDVLIYKNLIIFKKGFGDTIEVGDTLRLESDVVDCNLLVNKITYYYQLSGGTLDKVDEPPISLNSGSNFEKYIYCFSNFNQNIINNLLQNTGNITVKNLNKYSSVDDLVTKLNDHPISIGYGVFNNGNDISVTPRFNNKTAYYNLATDVITSNFTYSTDYNDAFLTFGYSPTYNIYDVLNKIDDQIFNSGKLFTTLPQYYKLPAAIGTQSTPNTIQLVVDSFSNKLIFGQNLKFQWESLLIWTFVDFVCYNNNSESIFNERLLIIAKYFDEVSNGYVMEFHKGIIYPDLTTGVQYIDIVSRNQLSQISQDLQILNNIQRTTSQKTINSTYSFTQYENEVKFKFPTDSYFKVLVSDYDIQQKVTAISYTDYDYQFALNIINVEKEVEYEFNSTNFGGSFSNKISYSLTTLPQGEFGVGDLVYVGLTGSTQSSKYLNPQYQGYQTIIDIQGKNITTAVNYGVQPNDVDSGKLTFVKRDNFLNYLPIDLYGIGGDKKPKKGVEILPEMVELDKTIFSLVNVNTEKYKVRFVDGLFLQEVEEKYSWFLQAETSDAVIGQNDNGLVWYSGTWRCGRWFGGTWISGDWLSGDWYDGEWYSSPVKSNILSVEVSANNSDNSLSKWQGGRWFGGSWYGGTWYDGRRYAGDWYNGIWFNGTWNDGNWRGGSFQGGIWVNGIWDGGKFNCDSKLSYWLDGTFKSGDFENGTWYNGQFGNQSNLVSRFGTRSVNTRISIWHGGKWISGEFHSFLNTDSKTSLPIVSDVHYLSVWRTGLWLGGDFYGGVAYNIDFKGGTWRGGILEEIQVIGVDAIYPGTFSTNRIYVNGIFKFNPGDEVYIIDDYRGTEFSPIGNNEKPGNYRINKIDEDSTNSITSLYLNYSLSKLDPAVDPVTGSQSWNNIETGLRVVSHFSESKWKSGLWTNGYFESGNFESGIWYNGVFEGNWSN